MRYTIKQLEIILPALDIAALEYGRCAQTARDPNGDGVSPGPGWLRVAEAFDKQLKDVEELQKNLQAHLDALYNQEV